MKLTAVLSLAALALPCTMARSENRGEAMATIASERSRLGAEKEEVDRKLAAASDPAEREALLAEQRRITEELRRLDEWEKDVR